MNYKTIIAYIIIVVGIIAAIVWSAEKSKAGDLPQSVLVPFAQCLAEKKITMYGAAWCTHCKAEKARFGEAFKYVPYVECPENEKLCLDKGIKGYPTWIDSIDTKYEGEQGLDNLSKISGCPLPVSNSN
jgi:hypothetical protein